MVTNIILILAVVLLVILAGLFAGAETGLYQFSRLRLRLGVEKKLLSFVILGKLVRDSPGLLLSMLIGTNLAHYLATSVVTILLLHKVQAEHTAGLFATLMTAPTLFAFSELIPKSIFFYRADSLMPSVAPVLFTFHKLLTWLQAVPLLKFTSRVFARLTGAPLSDKTIVADAQSSHIKVILQETREEGFLSPAQTDIIDRAVRIPNITLKSVATPINKVKMLDQNSDNSALLQELEKSAFTRLPVYDQSPSNIIGFVNIYEVLGSRHAFTDLGGFAKPLRRLPADTIVADAINIMQTENHKIVLVTKAGHIGREKPVGIVTMKDLVEELLGELSAW
ncbi:MAG: CNNM domain-containing protein [Planctomycetota bacterium]|jgi:CBS domain containing-hemolysin-like protein